jgi:hypothetical protein
MTIEPITHAEYTLLNFRRSVCKDEQLLVECLDTLLRSTDVDEANFADMLFSGKMETMYMKEQYDRGLLSFYEQMYEKASKISEINLRGETYGR